MMLALKLNVNDYYPLLKEYLDIAEENDDLTNLENIDKFTSKFTKEAIIDSIKRANIVSQEKLDLAELVIIYFEGKRIREYKSFTKEDVAFLEFNIEEFFYQQISNKEIINQIQNYFADDHKTYIPDDLKEFMPVLKRGSILQIVHDCSKLSYTSKRILKIYVFNEILPKLDIYTLKRNKNNNAL